MSRWIRKHNGPQRQTGGPTKLVKNHWRKVERRWSGLKDGQPWRIWKDLIYLGLSGKLLGPMWLLRGGKEILGRRSILFQDICDSTSVKLKSTKRVNTSDGSKPKSLDWVHLGSGSGLFCRAWLGLFWIWLPRVKFKQTGVELRSDQFAKPKQQRLYGSFQWTRTNLNESPEIEIDKSCKWKDNPQFTSYPRFLIKGKFSQLISTIVQFKALNSVFDLPGSSPDLRQKQVSMPETTWGKTPVPQACHAMYR